jgi:hypothetical protein
MYVQGTSLSSNTDSLFRRRVQQPDGALQQYNERGREGGM